MPIGNQWVRDITNLICNTTCPSVGTCYVSSFLDFATQPNNDFGDINANDQYHEWSTVLSMVLGAYSSAVFLQGPSVISIPITLYDAQFTPRYGIYILIVNIVVSVIMLIIAVRLCLASHLGPDFINSTRSLLDPLKKPELFNASLKTTVDALADPYSSLGGQRVFARRAEIDKRGGTDLKLKVYSVETLAEPIRSNLVMIPSRGYNH